jgi:hypothetical protein
MSTKNDINQGAGQQSKNDVSLEYTNSMGVPHNQKVNKAQQLTYVSTTFIVSKKNFACVNTSQPTPGSTKANRREPKTCLGQVVNYKLGCF